ncbi:ATP synthase subunit g, mitochondrial-like [Trichoplusia ni]|uniref:ATP synthase subunit g, mitochondrial-like n=1 Tax=Trichoplusia ni TaxID=7111 RepID=A0A7E5VC86_TRINI|nr:ATP synthase subunit g, mitochondrial-like [Trichoplusia ni]
MTASLSLSRLTNVLRSRLSLVHEIPGIYKPNITRKKEEIMELIREKAEIASKSELARRMRVLKGFYTVEMAPPSLQEMEKLRADIALAKEFIKTNCFKFITVRQAWLLFLVCLEIVLWFFLGETIGKFHIVGYAV